MIYVTGDMHGDITRFNDVKKSKIKKNDTLLVCGDFGFVWDNSNDEKKCLKKIGKHNYDVLFVDGCNENHKLLNEYSIVDYRGGKARKISGNLYCALRGEIYIINEKKVFCMGGGDITEEMQDKSNEKYTLPNEEEIEYAKNNLKKYNNKIDIIVTHDAPSKIKACVDKSKQELTSLHLFLDDVVRDVTFKEWYIGKFHVNKLIPPYYNMMFTDCKKADV